MHSPVAAPPMLRFPRAPFVEERFRTKYRFVEAKRKIKFSYKLLRIMHGRYNAVISQSFHYPHSLSKHLSSDDPQTRIDLVDKISTGELVPVGASLRDSVWNFSIAGGQGAGLLEEIDVETSTDVPGDVAVEGPHAGVVGLVADYDIPRGDLAGGLDFAGLDGDHIAAVGVAGIGGDGRAVPFADTGADGPEVVAVKMHRVGDGSGVYDVEENGGVSVKVVDVALSIEGSLAVVSVEK